MIVLFDVSQPQDRPIARLQLVELAAHCVVGRIDGLDVRFTAKPIEPRCLTVGASPAVGHKIASNREDVAAQLFITQSLDVGAQQTTERVLHDIVGVTRVTNRAIDIGPQRACRALIEPRKLNLGQRSTYTERAISFET